MPSASPASAAASPARGVVNLRIDASARRLIDSAAAALGKSRTEFMIESATLHALDVLLDQRLFLLDPDKYDAFAKAVDNPPAPGPKLKALMRRKPSWKS